MRTEPAKPGGLNEFYNGSLDEHEEPEEGEEIEIKYKYDYLKGEMFIYEYHKFTNGNEYRLYKGKMDIASMSCNQFNETWASGKASLFHNAKE